MKHYVIGTDEAGYGPNLGPLVICGTLWEIANAADHVNHQYDIIDDLCQRISHFVTENPSQIGKNGKIIAIGDSKKLHQSNNLSILARTVLASIVATKNQIVPLTGLLKSLGNRLNFADLFGRWQSQPGQFAEECLSDCHQKFVINEISGEFFSALTDADVKLQQISTQILTPHAFNLALDQIGNKATVLTHFTMSLITDLLSHIDSGQKTAVTILCDKHGGRNHYVDALYAFFSESGWVTILEEGRAISRYQLTWNNHQIEFRFASKADRQIPVALASMTAKFIRELFMNDWNRYWQQEIPEIHPTAGYPVDAVRFFAEIAQICQDKGIEKREIWREK